MITGNQTTALLPSLLDTLHGVGYDSPTGLQQGIDQIRESVRNDVEQLLNARCRPDALPEDLKYLHTALPNYGLPDLTNFSV